MMDKVIFINRAEGERMIYLNPDAHNLTKNAVLAMPKLTKSGYETWGGWIHAFYCLRKNNLVRCGDGLRPRYQMILERYDAYND